MNEDKVREALKELENLECLSLQSHTRNAKDLLKEALAPTPRFYKNQPVLVDSGSADYKRILDEIETGGYTDTEGQFWNRCKPDLNAESIINWVEHDEKNGNTFKVESSSIIIYEKQRGACFHERTKSGDFFRVANDTVRYAIIPLPEFIGE